MVNSREVDFDHSANVVGVDRKLRQRPQTGKEHRTVLGVNRHVP